ncbi:head-tail connector protein [Clostridium pasteurianum]|uniref:Phage QLRG family, putative DNA packaging n=1 Tax=Clostridium pasteurianum BC1 TaxID=86416 RepID=R4K8E1_CLOPA|nr:head-tail connector protein [Clostridium pasteurianum]AGK96799.1 Phage QLRG family, putative DNA packaging [Clostridium pasteurianum BC1]
MSLTTLDNVKSYLQITDGSEDSFLTLLIGSIQDLIENYCHRHFELATYTAEQHRINHKVFVYNYPIVSVQQIRRSSDDVLDIVLTQDDMTGAYRIYPNYIEMIDMKYVTMSGRTMYAMKEESYVEVDYTAGWTQDQIPSDLMLASTKLVALEYTISREGRIGLEMEREGYVQQTYYKNNAQSLPADVQLVLDRYKKVRV